MATIRQRKGKKGISYQVQVRVEGHRPVSASFRRKQDATEWAARTETEIRGGKFRDTALADGIEFTRLLDLYLEKITTKKAATTRERERRLAKALKAGFGGTSVTAITGPKVAAWRNSRLEKCAASTVRLELSLLSDLYRRARVEWGLQVENPVAEIKRPQAPAGRTVFLTENETTRLFRECRKAKNPMLYPFVLTLTHTGVRPGEAAKLRWRNVDMEKRALFLKETKTAPIRRVPITVAVQNELSKIRGEKSDDDYVFLSQRPGGNLSKRVPSLKFREAFEAARKRAGLDVRMYDLRHTAASHLLMAGVDMRTIADILGHKTLQMVMRYTHLLDSHKTEAIDKIKNLGIIS